MIIINTSQIDYSQIIINTINQLFSTLFSSLDKSLYSLLDKSVFVDESILSGAFFKTIFQNSFGLPTIADALLVGFAIYYCFRLSFAQFSGTVVEKPYQFLTKILIVAVCINCSSFICEQFLNVTGLVTDSLRVLGKHITGQEISFHNLISKSIYLTSNSETFNLFSIEGILKSFFSIGLISLLFSYSIRYILIKIFILLSPFAFLALINNSTSWFFKTWLRTFFSLLFVQIFVALILLLLFSISIQSSDLFSQISYISTVFILSKANNYVKELIGGLSLDINTNILSIKNLLK